MSTDMLRRLTNCRIIIIINYDEYKCIILQVLLSLYSL